jgi:hypothetical protein
MKKRDHSQNGEFTANRNEIAYHSSPIDPAYQTPTNSETHPPAEPKQRPCGFEGHVRNFKATSGSNIFLLRETLLCRITALHGVWNVDI